MTLVAFYVFPIFFSSTPSASRARVFEYSHLFPFFVFCHTRGFLASTAFLYYSPPPASLPDATRNHGIAGSHVSSTPLPFFDSLLLSSLSPCFVRESGEVLRGLV